MKGNRKTLWLTECLLADVFGCYFLELHDSGAILALSTGIVGIIGAAIYGNAKEWQSNKSDKLITNTEG